MTNKAFFKSLIVCFAFVLVACISLTVLLPFGQTSYADGPVNTVSFATDEATIAGGGLIKAQIDVTGKAGDVVKVSYHTVAGTAIPGVDYRAVANTVAITIGSDGKGSYVVALVCLNKGQLLRVNSEGEIYDRYFTLVIDSAENADVDTAKDTCKCHMPYDSEVSATTGILVDTVGSDYEVAYLDDYKLMQSIYNKGKDNLDGKKTWKSWTNGGVSFVNSTTTRWLNAYINNGYANAYGTYFIRKTDNSSVHSGTDIYLTAGNREMMEKYKNADGDTPGTYLYVGFEPDWFWTADTIDPRAMYLIAQGKNPFDDSEARIDVNTNKHSSDNKNIYWVQDGNTWYAGNGTFINSAFYKINPYNGTLDHGLAIWNKNKEVDIEFKDLWFLMTIVDDACPILVDSYADDSRLLSEGKLRFCLRFNEPVYASITNSRGERRSLEIKFNNLATPFYADYVEGNYTDTLVYEIEASKLPKINIKSISYTLTENDICDMAYNLDAYKNVQNNKLQNADQIRTFTILNGTINYYRPDLSIDKEKSATENNIYDLILSINAEEKADGTIYYEWSTSDTKANYQNGSAYQNAYVLNEEDGGSINVTLVKNESTGVLSGIYYLHALAVSPYGLKDYDCFGPYKLDGDPPIVTQSAITNELKTKVIEIVNAKTIGAALTNISLVVSWKDASGNAQTASLSLLEDGVRKTNRFTIVDENQRYRYISHIDESVATEIDDFILGIMGTDMRLDASVYFEAEDAAGNRSNSNSMRFVYDKRDVFKVESDFPSAQGYAVIDDINTFYSAYDVAAADRTPGKGISISIASEDRSQIVPGETAFSVTVNGNAVYNATIDPYTVVIGDLDAGFYELLPTITGETGGAPVDLVSNPICFYLTNGKNDNTVNYERTRQNLVLTNRVFQIADARYYYLDAVGSSVSSHLYGAVYDGALNKYDGGSSAPTFSAGSEAKKYVKFMEYQDLYLVSLTSNMASLLNSDSGSTTYMKAAGETMTAQEGQLWIRYKRSSWTTASNPYGWAYYYYGVGSVGSGINLTALSTNLNNAINTVVNRIVSTGEMINLVQDWQIDQTTGAPFLASAQVHLSRETADGTKSGTKYVVDPYYEGDPNLYSNNVVVNDVEYPLATNLVVTKNANTELYYKFGEAASWMPIDIESGQRLADVFINNASGIYTIREYGDFGVCEFPIYYDKTLPTLQLLINGDQHVLDGMTLNLSGNSAMFTEITSEVDALAYVAVYSYPSRSLQTVLYRQDVEGYTLLPGNYYVQVGDRSGNVATYTLLLSSAQLEVTATENESKTAVIIKVLNREESEIYSYEIYLNEELLTNEFAATKTFRDTGIYRVVVSDIYGNATTISVDHDYRSPKITWYYLNQMGNYSKYDENNITRMVVVDDLTNSRVTNVFTSTQIRLAFDLTYGDSPIRFEMLDIEPGLYVYSEATGVLTINGLASWRLRVWFESHPDNDHIYACQLDTEAPNFDASFIGPVFSFPNAAWNYSQQGLADIGAGHLIVPDGINYDLSSQTASYALFNGSVIGGNHISIKLYDPSGIKSYSVTRNGQPVSITLDANDTLLFNSYGHYVITALDALNNRSTFSFTNTKDAIATGTMGDAVLSDQKDNAGHEPLIITTKYPCDTQFLVSSNDDTFPITFNFDGTVLTYGNYYVGIESDDEGQNATYYVAEFVTDPSFLLSLGDDDVRREKWYPVIETDSFVISVMFDANGNVAYKFECIKTLEVEIVSTVGNGKVPVHYSVYMTQSKTIIPICSDGELIDVVEGPDYIYAAGTITFDMDRMNDCWPAVDTIEYAYALTPTFDHYETIYRTVYDDHSSSREFVDFEGTEDGYYQFVVRNYYGVVSTFTVCKVESFATIVTAIYQDETQRVFYGNPGEICANKEISLLVYNNNVHFEVNGDEYEGIRTRSTAELELNLPGVYNVRVVASNGIYEDFTFNIGTDYGFVYQEAWLTGYNESALMRDQGYTNRRLSVDLAMGVEYVDVVYNDETVAVIYDNVSETKVTDLDNLNSAVGRSGNGVYVVRFRNVYGDVVSKTIHYSILPSIILSRKTLANQKEWEVYRWGLVMIGVYSNYQVKIETTSSHYEFKLNGNLVSLDEPRILEFSNTSGNGTFEYKIEFLDEYGNYLVTRAILMRADVEIEKTQMATVVIKDVRYTRDNVAITFASALSATVSINGAEAVNYQSGTIFYKDGNYNFIIEDSAGNRLEYAIIHKSVNSFTLTDKANDQSIIQGGVINNSSVVFKALDDSEIKTIVKNGAVVKDYESNAFAQTGHWELLIEDSVGNKAYAEFYIINNSLGEFEYIAPYGYTIGEVWRTEAQGNNSLVESEGDSILLNTNGDYVVLVTGKEISSSFRFTVTIDNTPPTATLDGVENGGTTPRNVTLKGLKVGDKVDIYQNGILVQSLEITMSTEFPTIETGGDYRIVVTNLQGVSCEYVFTRKKIANTATSIFLMVLIVMIMAGIAVGLLYHTRHKTDK